MKKLLTVLLILALCCGFAACGQDEAYTVGIVQQMPHIALDSAAQGFQDALVAELGADNVRFLVHNAQGDPTTCTTIVNDLTTKKVDLILGNGTEKPVKINSVDVQVYNDETDELIAAGKVIVEEDVTVLVQDIAYYEFYISPEHIFVDNTTSLPEVCSFVIEIDGTPVVTE